MNNILTEKEYQAELLAILRDQNGYTIRKATDFDRRFALDREMLFGFLNDTQPETMEKLRKIHKDRLEDTIVSFINSECTKKRGSLLEVLVDFLGDGLVLDQLERGGLAVLVKLGYLKRDDLARAASRAILGDREEEAVATALVQDQTKELKVDPIALLVLEREGDTLLGGRAEIRGASFAHGNSFKHGRHCLQPIPP